MLQPNTNKSLYKAQSRYVPAVSPVQKRQVSFLKTLKKYVEIENRSRAEDEKEIKRNPVRPISPKSVFYTTRQKQLHDRIPTVSRDNSTALEQKLNKRWADNYAKYSSGPQSFFNIANIGALPYRYLASPEKAMGDVVNNIWPSNNLRLRDSKEDQDYLAKELSNPYKGTYSKGRDYTVRLSKELPAAATNLAIAGVINPNLGNVRLLGDAINPVPISTYHAALIKQALKRVARGTMTRAAATHEVKRVGLNVASEYTQDKVKDAVSRYSTEQAGEVTGGMVNKGIKKIENAVDDVMIHSAIDKSTPFRNNPNRFDYMYMQRLKEKYQRPVSAPLVMPYTKYKNRVVTDSAPLPADMEPYISKRVLNDSREQQIFESAFNPTDQAKMLEARTVYYDKAGKTISKPARFLKMGGLLYN